MFYYSVLVHGRWFSPGTPASSTTKTGRHDIDEVLQKVALRIFENLTAPIVDLIVANIRLLAPLTRRQ